MRKPVPYNLIPNPIERRKHDMSTVKVIAPPRNTETDNTLLQEIRLDKIKPSKINPRRRMDEAALAELSENIKTHGVLQPSWCDPRQPGGTRLSAESVAGEHRKRPGRKPFLLAL